jgi:chitodextrinase
VSYQGSVWQALWWTQNQKPGDPWGPWMEMATAPDGTARWTPSRVFTAGDTVVYQGKKYVAQWWTRNQEPGTPYGPWKLAG